MPKFKEYHQNQIMLMPPSLDERVLGGHLVRYISTLVGELNIQEIEEGYSEVGCRAYHPRMLMKEGNLGVGYNVQIATENQVIVGFGVYQKPNDNHLLQSMIEEAEQNLGIKPAAIVTDKEYCSQSNYEYVASRGIKAAIPPQTYDYDIAARRKGTYKHSKNMVYERLKVWMLDFLEMEEGKQLLDRRKHDIEPTFGDIKHNMGFRKLLLRLKPKVITEVGLVSIAHNIKKIKGWMEIQEMAISSC